MSKQESQAPPPLLLHQILEEEFAVLHGELPEKYLTFRDKTIESQKDEPEPERSRKINEALVPEIYQLIHGLPPEKARSALCLSGGGIRSATFALGIIQGLARSGLLEKFDYLSTVSGGGYIGSWLTAWIYNRWKSQTNTRDACLQAVGKELGEPTPDPLKPEAREIRHLRRYSHYLNPKIGFLSADTWTLIGTYLRNLLINWIAFLPLLVAALLIPRLCVAIVMAGLHQELIWPLGIKVFVFFLGLLSGVLVIFYMGVNRPSLMPTSFWQKPGDQKNFLRWCLLPLTVSGLCLTTFWAWVYQIQALPEINILGVMTLPSWLVFPLFGSLFHFLGWVGYASLLQRRKNIIELIIVLCSGAFGGWLVWLGALIILPSRTLPLASSPGIYTPGIYVCLALPVFLAAFLLAATVFVGLVSRFTEDEDREWWGRAGSWMLIVVVLWVGISSLVIFGPLALLQTPWLLGSVGGISGLISTILGSSAKTKPTQEKPSTQAWQAMLLNKGLGLATALFLMVAIASLSLGTSCFLKYLSNFNFLKFFPFQYVNSWDCLHLGIVNSMPLWPVGYLLFFVLALFGLSMSWAMNINVFSLHAMYRSRLIRAYLGASRERKPNPFTGFDPGDNIEMWQLLPEKSSLVTQQNKLLHVVNIALNLVHGQELAWQQRKAASFTVSPLHCGNFFLGYRPSMEYGKFTSKLFDPRGGKSAQNVGKKMRPITLGTAVTISGAAVSPNMGYHSSPVISFLLTLFNLRLGAWKGNPGPAGDEYYQLSQPKFAVFSMISEAFGLTDENNPYVYLSDGGHFENLGLYEMVLRRCRFIIVSDAGCDPNYSFADLGNAIHKIRVDLGVPIEFEAGIDIHSWNDQLYSGKRKNCAVGRIRYSVLDGSGTYQDHNQDGVLIYLKPVICGNEQVDIINYSKVSDKFPHETTGDQFFSEAQFESYRMLGLHTIEEIINRRSLTRFQDLEELVRDYLES